MFNYIECLNKYSEYGIVEEIYHPVVIVSGLPSVKPGELVVFENNIIGEVMHIYADKVEILVYSRQPVFPDMKMAKTNKWFYISLSDGMLGKTLDVMGRPYDKTEQISGEKFERNIDIPVESIAKRSEITDPLISGVTIVDMLLPLGKGQRELVVGDGKTGKTSFILNLIKTQILNGSIVIYAAIGKQIIEIESVVKIFREQNLLDKMIILAAPSHEVQSMIYKAPFTAMTMAEFFRDQGLDSVVILDDLSTHAKYYRELSLLARRFPGRDSYPGDIFYTHARILERAGNYIHPIQGTVAISCLPIAETTENDLTDYIVSNLIGITDGHILFDNVEFIKGRRPAINAMNSVTRVGRQTQSLLHQDLSQKLTAFITEYEKHQRLSHFGTELSDKVKETLSKGNQLFSVFHQHYDLSIPYAVQMLLCGLVWSNSMPDNNIDISEVKIRLINAYNSQVKIKEMIDNLLTLPTFYEFTDKIAEIKQNIWNICEIDNK